MVPWPGPPLTEICRQAFIWLHTLISGLGTYFKVPLPMSQWDGSAGKSTCCQAWVQILWTQQKVRINSPKLSSVLCHTQTWARMHEHTNEKNREMSIPRLLNICFYYESVYSFLKTQHRGPHCLRLQRDFRWAATLSLQSQLAAFSQHWALAPPYFGLSLKALKIWVSLVSQRAGFLPHTW